MSSERSNICNGDVDPAKQEGLLGGCRNPWAVGRPVGTLEEHQEVSGADARSPPAQGAQAGTV